MIVFINGSFGVGKTTVAEQLASRIPNSLVYDPEEVGFLLRNILRSVEQVNDFQDIPLWRPLVVTVAQSLQVAYHRMYFVK